MLDFVAFPTSITNEKDLDELYSDSGFISSENFYSSYKKATKRLRIRSLTILRQSRDRTISNENYDPSEVNAYYMPSMNRFGITLFLLTRNIIHFLAITSGILQPPFYFNSAPIAMNFAGIGTVIGHEMVHGFDYDGSMYDDKGDYKNWWQNETRKLYDEKTECFRRQYSDIIEPVTRKHVNGSLTIGDNLADNVGLQLSYKAYKMYAATKDSKMDLKLPESMESYSKEQLFFISFANLWCNDDSKDYLEEQIKYDAHAPGRFRAIVPPSNFDQFSKAFKCKEGSRMNPRKKCLLW
ncbi:hypothetical protein B4U80_09308 [Leptotrombidium deliense]|uniref:Peptidase M13 C-terminal domain-containing protein n=1 Tax=Leptotrombidium deliense TaxID=299467 RepID=A0A443S636_9ACAR|nr:hypothetical protein B4U80_09308 [Leptotrombidium deliense]